MGFSNPRTPWSQLAERLEGKHAPRVPETRAGAVDEHADGSDAPAFSRPDRYRVSVGPGGSDGADRYSGPEPEPQPERRRAGQGPTAGPLVRTGTQPWAELHVHSHFSFLDGASDPEELVAAGAAAELSSLALTDHNGLYGAVRFAHAAAEVGLPTVFGSELSLGLEEKIPGQVDPEATHLLVLARGVSGYHRLSAAITQANLRGEKNRPVFDLEELAAMDADWMILTGCRKGPLRRALDDADGGLGALRRLIALFGRERIAVELSRDGTPADDERLRHLRELAARTGLPVVASSNVHYATRAQWRAAQVRASIRSRRPLPELTGWLPASAVSRIHTGEEMAAMFPREALETAVRIGTDCAFGLETARPDLPRDPISARSGEREEDALRRLVAERGEKRYGTRDDNPRAWAQIDREMELIVRMGFCGYFLIVCSITDFCAENDIFCQGRGSAANSAVCYVLGITTVDAVKEEMLFDRFLSPERKGYPDIDIDIESGDRREAVIQHVYEHFGRDRAAQVANVITYRAKSSVRDAAHALGYEPGQQDAFSKTCHGWSTLPKPEESDVPEQVLDVAGWLLGSPRHLGIHSGGMILTDRPIGEVVPIEHATMENRTVVQWDKDDCAEMDLVKFDLLGLGMLNALHEMVDLVAEHEGKQIDRAALGTDDPAVYEMLSRADAVGVFQVESRAQLATLPRLRPETFYDLAVEVALIRPGPIQGGAVHPYIRRKQKKDPVTFLHPLLEKSLAKTLGVPLFQEQLMQMSIDVGGFTGADADQLRQAMASNRSQKRMAELKGRFMRGAAERNVDEETAESIFATIAAFANYGFPESHAISFASLVYQSAWFKLYHHAAFTVGLLRCQPMGFYSPQSLIADARRHGVPILPVDIRSSGTTSDLELVEPARGEPGEEGGAPAVFGIRLGFEQVTGVSAAAETIVTEREKNGPFTSVMDLAERTGIGKSALESLATAGAFDCFGLDRRQALWLAGGVAGAGPTVLPGTTSVTSAPALPLMDSLDMTLAELFSTGITVDGYPTEILRESLTARGYASIDDAWKAADGQRMTVAGIVTHRQRPATASGITFINLEDEFGMLNVVATAGLMKRFRKVATTKNVLVVSGLIQRGGDVVSLYAHKLLPLDVQFPTHARNFR
ncbi:DnaE-like error-prone DNA polymerase [Brevibacterium sanguinis]|uniref:Error-prone DNA polymerase n=2 Tax=Brevibacterium TaxID=1696 RepID=A0A366IJA2_9MICO|nr:MULTISPECIES: error-prone DNA polymerase [Brevibacterium]RBP64670.1 DnaE-like error-prone DNA polymerase [Brevibacterium sanguinis]RBP71687.1 DnaE-like error-prone DNA polymerase [Brevibacterium celere]